MSEFERDAIDLLRCMARSLERIERAHERTGRADLDAAQHEDAICTREVSDWLRSASPAVARAAASTRSRTSPSSGPDAALPPPVLPQATIQRVRSIHVALARAEAFLAQIRGHLEQITVPLPVTRAAWPEEPPASPPPADGGE